MSRNRTHKPRADAIQYQIEECGLLELLSFFKKAIRDLTPEEKKDRKRWLKIIDVRIARLPILDERGNGRGRTQLNSRAARGIETSLGDCSKIRGRGAYPKYMEEADEKREAESEK